MIRNLYNIILKVCTVIYKKRGYLKYSNNSEKEYFVTAVYKSTLKTMIQTAIIH